MMTAARQLGVGHFAVGTQERAYVQTVLDTGRLSYGPFTRAFEHDFAALHGVKFAAFCNSGTSALQATLHAMKLHYGWQDGDEVLVPALTFVATVNVVLQNNLKPVLVDVDPTYFEIDPQKLDDALTRRTRAVLPVHIGGCPCDIALIRLWAGSKFNHPILVLEDSCETMFVGYRGKPVGSWGTASCFSTYVAHLLTTGVGGFACTSDPELAALIRSLLNHGRDGIYLSIDDDAKEGAALREVVSKRFKFDHVGYSYRATELEAAIGLGQLARYQDDLARRRAIAARLNEGLDGLGLQLPHARPEADHAWMFYPIVRPDHAAAPLCDFLEEHGVETRPLLPLVTQPVYQKLGLVKKGQFPVAEWLADHAFYVGCHPGLTDADVDRMVETIREGVHVADFQ